MIGDWVWTFGDFRVYETVGQLRDVIKEIPYSVTISRGTNSVTINGVYSLPEPTSKKFVPYQSLTQTDIIRWIQDDMKQRGLLDDIERRLTVSTLPSGTPRWQKQVAKQKATLPPAPVNKATPF